ncbi:SMP-30/gluconolactonase/LRE family protein [Castellaniella sp.]|uniref:SMP-30/gluconolactonase/LRE family protein n=1 Tax=Castellaniella sp. TaxID=1955812 RepID=UPI00356565A2
MSRVMDYIHSLFDGDSSRAIPPLDGVLAPNNRLDDWVPLVEGLAQPTDLAVLHGQNQFVYNDGDVLYLHHEVGATRVQRFAAAINALATLPDGHVVIGLANGELLKATLDSGPTPGLSVQARVCQPELCGLTAITAAPDGKGVYFTIGSTEHATADWVRDLFDKGVSGSLGYWGFDDQVTTLHSGLAYPSGVAASPDGTTLLVTESWNHRVLKFRGHAQPQASAMATVLNNLPGYPGRIRARADGGYWLSIFALRTQLVEFVLGEDRYRTRMLAECAPELWIRPALSSGKSNLEPLQYGNMKALGIEKPWAPARSYGLLTQLDGQGQITDSMHCRAGGIRHGLSSADTLCNGRTVVLSVGAGCILISPENSPAKAET